MSTQKAKFDIQPLFVEPIVKVSLASAIDSAQIKFIKNLKMVKNRTNLISEDLYIFENPELLLLKSAIQDALDFYTDVVMGISQKLYITQSWALTNPPGDGMHGHSHSNSVVSGSFYYDELPKPGANMVFDRHNDYQRLVLNPDPDKHNLYNTPASVVEPKTHDLVLFCSSLQHRVESNVTKKPRRALAFNTFIKGKLGDYRDVSELNL